MAIPRNSVKKITATIGGVTVPVYSASVINGRTTTNGEIAGYDDTLFTRAISPVLHAADLTIDVLDEGDLGDSLRDLVGQTVTTSIKVLYGNNNPTSGEGSDIITSGKKCVVLSVTGDSVAVDSDGRSLIHVTLREQA